ncbi:MAG TPA: thioredoxin domain-containing protein [Longimicrobiales bacterium]
MRATKLPPLDEATFDDGVARGAGLVAVEFGAEWCGPCRVMEPVLEAAVLELAGVVRFHEVDADANPGLVARYGVRGLPTVLVFRDGGLIDRIIGAQPRERFIARLRQLIGETTTETTT